MNSQNKISYEKLENSRISFELSVSVDQIQKAKKIALRELGAKIEIGGFRKGKAPVSVVEKNIEKEKLLIETVDTAIKESYYDAVMQHKDEFICIGRPDIDFDGQVDEKIYENGFKFKVAVDIYPEIKLPDVTKLKVKKEEIAVTKEELQNTINDILKKRSKLELHQDGHKIVNGDWADINFEVLLDGKVQPELGSKDFPLVVGNNMMIPGFEEKLLGLSKGEEKEFSLEIDQNFRDKRMAGKKVNFKILVNEVKKLVPPVLDDEFVKSLKITEIDNKKDFEKYLQESLEKEKEYSVNEKLKNDIVDAIEKNTQIEIPISLREREIHVMWHEFEDNLKRRGIEPNDYMQKEGLDAEKIKAGWVDQADKRAKIALLIGELVKGYEITVDKKELNDYIERELNKVKASLMQNYPADFESMYVTYQKEFHEPERERYFEQQLMVDKLFGILIEKMVS